jgi:hypothetical protein
MSARVKVNPAVRRSYEAALASSNTLMCGDRGRAQTTRAGLIEATVQALAGGSDPRLDQSRAHV